MSEHTVRFSAFKHMTRFRCIAAACEESCCSQWQITVEREYVTQLERTLGQSASGRRELAAGLALVPEPARDARKHALLVLQESGSCSFLSPGSLCTLQQRFGESMLSDTCAMYPRVVNLTGERREMVGALSCPEVARELLLKSDAMDLVEVPADAFARPWVRHKVEDHPQDPYTRYHDELRNLMFDLLSEPQLPLSTRLSSLAYFANRTRPFLYRGVEQLDEERLLFEIERIQSGNIRTELHRQFAQLATDAITPARVAVALLWPPTQLGRLQPLVRAVFARYTQGEELDAEPVTSARVVETVVESYLAERQRWSVHADRIDAYLTNYAKSYLAQNWYGDTPDLLVHITKLLVHLVLLRFLLHGHPTLADASACERTDRELALDRAIVETVVRFSRPFQHDRPRVEKVQAALGEAGLISLAHAINFAAF